MERSRVEIKDYIEGKLIDWTNASFDVSGCHVWRDAFDDVVDLEVPDASLIVSATLDATNLR